MKITESNDLAGQHNFQLTESGQAKVAAHLAARNAAAIQEQVPSVTTYEVELSRKDEDDWYVKDSGITTREQAAKIAKSWLPYQRARIVEVQRRVVAL